MNSQAIKQKYISLLEGGDINYARFELSKMFNQNNIKLDIRSNDWVYLCNVKERNNVLVLGSSYGDSCLNLCSEFNEIDVVTYDEQDAEIVALLSKGDTKINLCESLLDIETKNQYDLIYIESGYECNSEVYNQLKSLMSKDCVLAHRTRNSLFSRQAKMLLNCHYSIQARYAWLPVCDGSPMFIFDIDNTYLVKYFLQNMINIFNSVSPEDAKKYALKIMLLKWIKRLFFIKPIRKLFVIVLPCYLIIATYD